MARLYIPPPQAGARIRLTAFDLFEIACIAAFAGNLLFWAALFAEHAR